MAAQRGRGLSLAHVGRSRAHEDHIVEQARAEVLFHGVAHGSGFVRPYYSWSVSWLKRRICWLDVVGSIMEINLHSELVDSQI